MHASHSQQLTSLDLLYASADAAPPAVPLLQQDHASCASGVATAAAPTYVVASALAGGNSSYSSEYSSITSSRVRSSSSSTGSRGRSSSSNSYSHSGGASASSSPTKAEIPGAQSMFLLSPHQVQPAALEAEEGEAAAAESSSVTAPKAMVCRPAPGETEGGWAHC